MMEISAINWLSVDTTAAKNILWLFSAMNRFQDCKTNDIILLLLWYIWGRCDGGGSCGGWGRLLTSLWRLKRQDLLLFPFFLKAQHFCRWQKTHKRKLSCFTPSSFVRVALKPSWMSQISCWNHKCATEVLDSQQSSEKAVQISLLYWADKVFTKPHSGSTMV